MYMEKQERVGGDNHTALESRSVVCVLTCKPVCKRAHKDILSCISISKICACVRAFVRVCNESLQAPAVRWTKRQKWSKPVVLQLSSDLEDIKDAKTETPLCSCSSIRLRKVAPSYFIV